MTPAPRPAPTRIRYRVLAFTVALAAVTYMDRVCISITAPHISREAKLVKLADKIVNLRDVAERAPAKWDLARRREYFGWAKQVIDGLRGTDARLEAAFDAAYEKMPR